MFINSLILFPTMQRYECITKCMFVKNFTAKKIIPKVRIAVLCFNLYNWKNHNRQVGTTRGRLCPTPSYLIAHGSHQLVPTRC